jgi:hypothetical protein
VSHYNLLTCVDAGVSGDVIRRCISSAAARKAAQRVNLHHPDDIVADPLRTLNAHYAQAVDRDQAVSMGPPILGNTPVSRVAYLNSRKLMRPIARRLAMVTASTD